MVGDFNTTALKLNFSDQNGGKEKCLENTLNCGEASKFFWQFQMPEWSFYVLESLLDLIQDNVLQIPDFFQTDTPLPEMSEIR